MFSGLDPQVVEQDQILRLGIYSFGPRLLVAQSETYSRRSEP